jgi:hypothetical protein
LNPTVGLKLRYSDSRHAYKQLSIPPSANGISKPIEKEALDSAITKMGKHSHFASGDPEIQGVIDAILANRKLVLDPEVIRKEVSGKVDAGNNALNCEFSAVCILIPVDDS